MLRQPLAAGVVVLCAGAALSLGVALLVREQWQGAVHTRFERRTTHVTAMLRHELQSSVAVLEGARGAFSLVPGMTPEQWRRYADLLDLDSGRSPVRQIGYAPLPPATRTALAAAKPMPAGTLAAAALSAPASNSPVVRFGASDAAPLARALQTGDIALGVHPADDDTSRDARTLTLFLPVAGSPHAASGTREGATDGVLFAALSPRRLIERALDAERGIDVWMTTGGDRRAIVSVETTTDEASASSDLMRRTDELNFGGTVLTLAYSADGRPSATGAQRAAGTVLTAGLIASIAFAVLVHALLRGRTGAADSGASSRGILNEARMMGIIRSSMEAIITIDEKQTVVIFNPMAEQVFGVSAMEAIGAPLSRFIPERFRAAHAKHVDQFGVTGVSERQMGRQRVLFGLRANGEEFPIEASISQIRDASGKLYTVMLRDITERLRAENALKLSREELRELSANLQNVREEEKTRIARELHDDLGQQLTALKMDLSVVEQQLRVPGRAPDEGVQSHLQGMRRLIDATVASVRRIAADLRPVMLDDLGLVPAIEWLANDFTNRYGIDVERHIETGGLTFTSAGATTLFRIVQEALTNVARHADATRVALRLDVEEGFCVLRVADNGRGSAPGGPAHEDKSFGLIGIRERAHMLGGTVTIDTALARGFSITVALPLGTVQQETLIT